MVGVSSSGVWVRSLYEYFGQSSCFLLPGAWSREPEAACRVKSVSCCWLGANVSRACQLLANANASSLLRNLVAVHHTARPPP